jgi:hypothetical protein
MQAITVEMVCNAAKKLLETNQRQPAFKAEQKFTEISESFFCDKDYETGLGELGLTSMDAVFSFNEAHNLTKDNLPRHRSRLRFEINSPPATLFLKRYDSPLILVQLGNWLLARRRVSCGLFDFEPTTKLTAAGINTPKIISYGEQWGIFFEKRSFIVTEKIPDAESLYHRLPDCFNAPATIEKLKLRRNFIAQLAAFVKKFHETDYRHRDLYLSHIFSVLSDRPGTRLQAGFVCRTISDKRCCAGLLFSPGQLFFKNRPVTFLSWLHRPPQANRERQSIYP